MQKRTLARHLTLACLAAALALAVPPSARGQDTIAVELNKMDQRDADCRLTFLIRNAGPDRFVTFKSELVLFGDDGVIDRRFTGDIAPLRPAKTSVVSFDLKDLKCTNVGQVLLNDIVDCQDVVGARTDCVDAVTVSSRAGIPMIK